MYPFFRDWPGEHIRFPVGPGRTFSSASEMNSGLWLHRSTCGGRPQSVNAFIRAGSRSSARVDLSTMLSTDCRVCSSTIDVTKEFPPVGGRVELEVDRPYAFRRICLGNRSGPGAGWFPDFADLHPQSFLAPEALNLLLVDHPTVSTQICPRPPELFFVG